MTWPNLGRAMQRSPYPQKLLLWAKCGTTKCSHFKQPVTGNIFACFPSLKVALPEGVLWTPTVHTSNRSMAWILLSRCKLRYNIRAPPSNLNCSSQRLSSILEGMLSLLFTLFALRLINPIRPLKSWLNAHLMLHHWAVGAWVPMSFLRRSLWLFAASQWNQDRSAAASACIWLWNRGIILPTKGAALCVL